MININLVCDLQQAVKVQYLDGVLFTQDAAANTINVDVYDNGEPASLSGTVSADIIRVDGGTVPGTGSISGNRASVTLPPAAYAYPGLVSITIKITSGSTVATIAALVANVYESTTSTPIDPGTIIPDINTLIAAIEAAVASVPADYSALLGAIASDYSNAKTYKVGDYCWYNGDLKRCIVAINSPETYTAAHWEDAVIGDDLSNLNAAMNGVLASYKLETGKYRTGQYSISTGAISSDSRRNRGYDFIEDDVVFVRSTNSEISLILAAWDGDTYMGWLVNGVFAKTGSSGYLYPEINIAALRMIYPTYKYKIMTQKISITLAETADAVQYRKNDAATKTYVEGAIAAMEAILDAEIATMDDKVDSVTEETYNLIDLEAFKADGVTINDGVVSGLASAFNTAFSTELPLGITFEDATQYTITLKARTDQANASTGTGLRFKVTYTDTTTSFVDLVNTMAEWTAVNVTTAIGKTVSSISMYYSSGAGNTWWMKEIQLVKGTALLAYMPHLTAVDSVARQDVGSLFYTRKILPDYYFAVPETASSYAASDYLNQKIASVPEGKHFIFITDVHWKVNNTHNSTAMMKYVKDKLGIKHIFHGGDVLNQEVSKYIAGARMAEYMNEVYDAFGDNFFSVQGNHDLNVANLAEVLNNNPGLTEEDVRMSYQVVYKYLVEPISHKVHFEDCTAKLAQTGAIGDDLAELEAYCKLHYYMDDDDQRIRYIVVCTTNTQNNGVVRQYFGARSLQEMYLQYDWIYQTLLDTPDNYDVVVMGHSYMWSGPTAPEGLRPYMPHEVGVMLGRMLSGLRYHTNVTVRNTSNDELLDSFYAYGAHTYAFSNDTKHHDIVVGISGDKHFDGAYIVDTACTIDSTRIYDAMSAANKETLLTVTLCDARAVPQEDYNGYLAVMTAGTITEQAFDVVTITNDHRLIYTRFGCGNNRVFNFPQ